MANNYTQFSVSLALPDKEAVEYALNLHTRMDIAHQDDCKEPDYIPREWWPYIKEWGNFATAAFAHHSQDLWIYDGGESGDVESAALLIQHLLAKFLPDECFYISWAATCSKPSINEFGGGALFITEKKITSVSSWEWAEQQQLEWNVKRGQNAKP